MKAKIILSCLCLLFVSTAFAQPKPKLKPPSSQGNESSKEIRKLLDKLYKEGKLVGKTNPNCDPAPYVASWEVRHKLAPRLWALGRIVDTLFAKDHFSFHIHKSFENSKTLKEFTELYHTRAFDKLSETEKKIAKGFYDDLQSLSKDGLQIQQKTFKVKPCVITVNTKLFLSSIRIHEKNKYRPGYTDFYWGVKSTVDVKCDCVKENKTNLRNAKLEYTGKLQSELRYFPGKRLLTTPSVKPNFQYKVLEAVCCPIEEPKTEDGSFIDPNEDEDISFPNQFIEVGAGVATAKDEETELCASIGFLHNLLPGEENALFIGGRASVHNTSFSGPDFSQTLINVGPVVEYQTFIGNTATKWINGINGAFVFGSSDNAGFKTDISGFNLGLYTGVEVPLGNQFALGVMATLLEYNNQTFKADEGELKSNSTGININKGSVGLSLRIDLDKN